MSAVERNINLWKEICDQCNCRKVGNIKSTRPLELVCMDFMSQTKYHVILVIIDHFTEYAVIPVLNQKAQMRNVFGTTT